MRISMTESHSYDTKPGERITLPAGGVFNVDDTVGEEIIELGKGVDLNANNVPKPAPLVDDGGDGDEKSETSQTPPPPETDEKGGESGDGKGGDNSNAGEDVLTSNDDDENETIVDAEIVKIVDAIKNMSASDFTDSGHPKIQPLSEKLGFKPTQAQVAAAKTMMADA